MGEEKGTYYDSYGYGDADFIIYSPNVSYNLRSIINLSADKLAAEKIPDQIAQLRKLLKGLADEIQKADNSISLDGDVGASRAYIQAFLAFLDTKNTKAHEQIPAGLFTGFIDKLKKTDWVKVSSAANNIASAIEKIFKLVMRQ